MFTFRDEHVPMVLNVQYMLPICSAHDLEAPEFIHFRLCERLLPLLVSFSMHLKWFQTRHKVTNEP
jgi:hypothetical protein